jgi:hypothetical protein
MVDTYISTELTGGVLHIEPGGRLIPHTMYVPHHERIMDTVERSFKRRGVSNVCKMDIHLPAG